MASSPARRSRTTVPTSRPPPRRAAHVLSYFRLRRRGSSTPSPGPRQSSPARSATACGRTASSLRAGPTDVREGDGRGTSALPQAGCARRTGAVNFQGAVMGSHPKLLVEAIADELGSRGTGCVRGIGPLRPWRMARSRAPDKIREARAGGQGRGARRVRQRRVPRGWIEALRTVRTGHDRPAPSPTACDTLADGSPDACVDHSPRVDAAARIAGGLHSEVLEKPLRATHLISQKPVGRREFRRARPALRAFHTLAPRRLSGPALGLPARDSLGLSTARYR